MGDLRSKHRLSVSNIFGPWTDLFMSQIIYQGLKGHFVTTVGNPICFVLFCFVLLKKKRRHKLTLIVSELRHSWEAAACNSHSPPFCPLLLDSAHSYLDSAHSYWILPTLTWISPFLSSKRLGHHSRYIMCMTVPPNIPLFSLKNSWTWYHLQLSSLGTLS